VIEDFVSDEICEKLRKEEWKYLPFIHPLHPSKHASTDNISSGLEILFDTQKLTIAIDENRLTEIRLLVECWMHKMMASKKELQSLLGKLNFVAQCVSQRQNYNNVLLHNQPNHLNNLKFEYHFFDR
jgi:hypothetical protein